MNTLRFLSIASLLSISLLTVAEKPLPTTEVSFWETLKNSYLNPRFHVTIYPGDIKIQLSGNCNSDDSLCVDQFASELSGILENVKIYRVKDHGNLILTIQTLPDSVYELGNKGVKNKTGVSKQQINFKTYYSKEISALLDSLSLDDIMENRVTLPDDYISRIWYYYVRVPENGEKFQKGIDRSYVQLQIRQSAPQIIRNKAIFYYLTNELIIPNQYKKQLVVRNDHSMLETTFPLTARFLEKDSFILSKAYSRDLYLQLYIHYPRLFLKSLKYRFGNYSLMLYFTFSVLIVLFYLLVLFKKNRILSTSESWYDYMKTGMWIMQSATIMYFMYKLYEGKMIHQPFPAILGEAIVVPTLFSFISLNVFYFLEKSLIRKNSTILQRLYIQLFVSLIPVFFLVYNYHWNTVFLSFVMAFSFIMIIGRLAYTYFNFKTQNAIYEKDLEILHFREMQHSAELQALHSRINPHFLYNSLNSIAGLARVNPEKTEKMALALSEFCRYTINRSNSAYSTVLEETELANVYIEIEKVRFGERLYYECDASDDTKNKIIPRFMIQPLIENAIKHGVTQLTGQGKIKLVIYIQDHMLKIEVHDNGPAFSDSPVKGYGLQSIYDKLEILYKGNAHMNWQNEPEKYISVMIPLPEKD